MCRRSRSPPWILPAPATPSSAVWPCFSPKARSRRTPWRARISTRPCPRPASEPRRDRKSTRLNSSHLVISYAVFCLKKKTHAGAIAFAGVLVVGFALHNITEGFGIAAPMTTDPNPVSWGFLGLAGLIAGGPTFAGTWIGYLASSDYLNVAFLAIAAGALLYVLNELFHIGRRLCSPPQFAWGLLFGFLTAYATDLFLTAVSI